MGWPGLQAGREGGLSGTGVEELRWAGSKAEQRWRLSADEPTEIQVSGQEQKHKILTIKKHWRVALYSHLMGQNSLAAKWWHAAATPTDTHTHTHTHTHREGAGEGERRRERQKTKTQPGCHSSTVTQTQHYHCSEGSPLLHLCLSTLSQAAAAEPEEA